MSGLSLFSKGSGRQKVEKWRKIRSRRVATFLLRPACSPRSQVFDDKEKAGCWPIATRVENSRVPIEGGRGYCPTVISSQEGNISRTGRNTGEKVEEY